MRQQAGRGAINSVARTMAATMLLGAIAACGPRDDPWPTTLGYRAGGGLFDDSEFIGTEKWLGANIHYTVQFSGRKSQRDMNGSVFGLLADPAATLPKFADRVDLSLTVPLGFGSAKPTTREGRDEIKATLKAVADGEYDEAYQRIAGRLVDAGFDDAIIRLGHEFNGTWAPWSSRTNEAEFIAAWRHVHAIMRAEAPGLRFEWTAVRPAWVEWGPPAYPGDDYVDIVGLDIYWRVEKHKPAWDSTLWDRQFLRILHYHHAFAMLHNKPISYPEWGLSGADSPQFIEAMHEWLSSLPTAGPGRLLYHAYFDDSGAFDLDKYPRSRDTYRQLFGG